MVTESALRARIAIIRHIQRFFDERGFVEVSTPVRISAPAPEPHIDCPVVTGLRDSCEATRRTYLRASPELQMKKLLAAGMEKIYQIGPCFREGEKGSRHLPEFCMLEWYRANGNYLDILHDMETLVESVLALSETDKTQPFFQAHNCKAPFRRLLVRDVYRTYAGWDPFETWDQDRFDYDMATKIEPALPKYPLFLMDYPPEAASLSKLRGNVAERWELYVNGIELANAFTELVDPDEQRSRFESARRERAKLDEMDYPLDEEFLSSLGAMPPSGGVALGVDRLVMLALGARTIADVTVVD